MSNFHRYSLGDKLTAQNGLTGIVVRQMRRIPMIYVVWGAVDLDDALQLERTHQEVAEIINLGV